jgi:protein-tyrosine phosphatase
MREPIPARLWLVNARDARDYVKLFERGVQAVVDLAMEELPAAAPRELIWLRFPLVDGAGNAPARLRAAVAALVKLLEEQIPTLVACSAGMSRTPVIAAAAIAIHRREPPDACLAKLVEGHPHDISPQLWRDVKAACLTAAE